MAVPNTAESRLSENTNMTAQAPQMNAAFQPKQSAAVGVKPTILGTKPNFMAKKRKF